MTHQGRDLFIVVLGTVLIGIAYAAAFLPGGAPLAAAWLMVGGMTLVLVGLMILGARRAGSRLGRLRWVFGFVVTLLLVCFGGALLLEPSEGPGSLLIFGLPLRAALVMIGVGVVPTLVLPVAYALTFDEQTLRPGDLDAIRRAAEMMRERGG
jgi:Na+/proline symporter